MSKLFAICFALMFIDLAQCATKDKRSEWRKKYEESKREREGGVYYDKEFWDEFENEKPYNHTWLDTPDIIDMANVEWYFNLTRQFLTGVERGLYNNDSLEIDEDCFGPMFVERINWLAAMFEHKWYDFIGAEIAIIYQLTYMWGEKCSLDRAQNDLYIYCWNQGCRGEEILYNLETRFLYMTRALIDSAIVWYEGVPGDRT